MLVVLPNLLFWILAGLTGTARPIINLDYIAAAALFALGWKPAKWAGVLLFWAALLFDVLSGACASAAASCYAPSSTGSSGS